MMNDNQWYVSWRRWRSAISVLALSAVMVAGCDGGCDIDGFSEAPFPEESHDYALEGSGEVRVTESGFDFVGDEIANLVDAVAGDELSFCLEPISESGADICHEDSVCDNGETGCQLDIEIEDAAISPEEPNLLEVEITVGLQEELPISVLLSDCWLSLYSDALGSDDAAQIPATVEVEFLVDQQSALDDVMVEVGDLEVDIDDLAYDLSNRDSFGCGVLDWGVQTFLDGTVRDLLMGQLDDVVGDLLDDGLCRSCEDGDLPCPSGSSCEEGEDDSPALCQYEDADRCVPLLLGIEGQLELDALLTDMVGTDVAEVMLTGRVADRAEANTGLSLGLKAGFDPAYESTCVPVHHSERPPTDPLAPLEDLGGDTRPDGEPYMFGVGLHRMTMDHLLWSIWASGTLCLMIDGEDIDLLNTDAFGFFVGSLEDIATESGPMQIRLAPQQAPTVEFGDNVVEDGDVIEELLRLHWEDLDVHIYGYVQERMARLFTLRIDLDMPLGVEPVDEGLLLVLGDIGEAFGNIRLRNDALVSEDISTFEDLIPTILDIALPELLDALDEPFELPEFFGFEPVIDEGGLTAVDDGEGLGIFASLEFVGNGFDLDDMAVHRSPLRAVIESKELRIDDPADRRSPVELRLSVAAQSGSQIVAHEQVDYLYRWGEGGPWRRAGQGPEIVIDDPLLRLPGEHRLELRARPVERGWAPMQTVATSGQITVDRRTQGATSAPEDAEFEERRQAQSEGASTGGGQAGCGAAGGTTGWVLVVLMGMLMGVARWRRRRTLGALALVAMLGLMGCSSDESGSDENAGEPLDCPAGEVEVCDEDDECACEAACADGCDDGQACCYEDNACVAVPSPCADQECPAGTTAEVVAEMSYDSETCTAEGGSCDCVANDPLKMGFYGAYPSIDQGGDVTALSVHNLEYFDLMVRPMVGDEHDGEWIFVDGVPDMDPVGDPDGPRWGIRQIGPRVGSHTATVVDESEQIHVFYRDMSEDALRYARGEQSGGEWTFDRVDLEAGDGVLSGYYSAATYRDGEIHLVSTSAVIDEARSEMRHRVIDPQMPLDEASDVEIEVLLSADLELDEDGEWASARPPMVALYTRWVEGDDHVGLSFVDWSQRRLGWLALDEEEPTPTWVAEDTGPYGSVAVDEEGELHAAYMDRSVPALAYRDGDGNTEWIVDGVRDREGGWSEGEVGHDVQLWKGDEGWEVVYHDASTHEIRHVTRGDDGWESQSLAGELGEKPARGLFVGAHRLGDGIMIVDMAVDTTDIDASEAEPRMEWLDGP